MQWTQRVRPGIVALAVLSVLTVVLLVLAIQRTNAPPPAYSPPAGAAPAPSQGPTPVAFLGDSVTAGTLDGGLGASNYTQLLATRSNWTVTNAAADGAGYVAALAPGGTFREAQLPRVLAARPSVVVVQGGGADAGRPSPEVRDAATRLYTELRQSLPQARIVVIGPVLPGQDRASAEQARDAVREAAATAQLPFLDPIADGWFDDADGDLVKQESEHLTDDGHVRMADLTGEGLRRIGVAPR